MKTPRDILFARHESTAPDLDWVRRQALKEAFKQDASASVSFPTRVWRELFWSCRKAWIGIAVAWVFIIAANMAMVEPLAAIDMAGSTHKPMRSLRMALAQQRQLQQELLDQDAPVAEEVKKSTPPRPHSEKQNDRRAA